MVIPLQGEREKILRLIFHTSIGWKSLFHIYRLSKKSAPVHAGILSKELGHNVSNVRKVLIEMESMGLLTKTKIQKSEIIYISKVELTPFGEQIAADIFNIVKTVYQKVDDKEIMNSNSTSDSESE